jgi:N-sulfoglucosamine sulfohydrolase
VIVGFLISACTTRSDRNASKEKGDKGKRPNILLIVSEDNGPHLSCYGDPVIKTPNLDNIAEKGILFRNAYVTQAVSSPSRSSILTGLYPHQNGHLGLATHGYHFVGKVRNIYQIMKDAGYRTGMIGKLHLNPESDFPIDFHPIKGSNFEKKGLAGYSEFAGNFINESDDPFFLMVNFPDAHFPFQDTVENRPAKVVDPENVKVFPYIGFENERLKKINSNIYNCMLRLDECVGELMNKLSDSGKEDNTIVIYLGDHGCQMARAKIWVYEASDKIPFIVKWKGKVKEGIQSDALISTIDIVPTLCEVLGVEIPDKVSGKSLLPLFNNPDLKFREHMFVERNCDAREFYFPQRAIRDGRYKLIYTLLNDRKDPAVLLYTGKTPHPAYRGTLTQEELKSAPQNIIDTYNTWLQPPELQLYDLQNDPWEFKNLANKPGYEKIRDELFEKLKKWQVDTDDPLRFPERLKALTTEHDTIITSSKRNNWLYPKYLYDQ